MPADDFYSMLPSSNGNGAYSNLSMIAGAQMVGVVQGVSVRSTHDPAVLLEDQYRGVIAFTDGSILVAEGWRRVTAVRETFEGTGLTIELSDELYRDPADFAARADKAELWERLRVARAVPLEGAF
jgi:hypothetical protein